MTVSLDLRLHLRILSQIWFEEIKFLGSVEVLQRKRVLIPTENREFTSQVVRGNLETIIEIEEDTGAHLIVRNDRLKEAEGEYLLEWHLFRVSWTLPVEFCIPGVELSCRLNDAQSWVSERVSVAELVSKDTHTRLIDFFTVAEKRPNRLCSSRFGMALDSVDERPPLGVSVRIDMDEAFRIAIPFLTKVRANLVDGRREPLEEPLDQPALLLIFAFVV
ncbi:hypothetical protein [Halorubrum sp. N11]|uniref:hypothetical protein n=1 Tax=Halorubrum sp. N11 TaxID=3402276 RepID=UPI003EB88CDD